MFKQLSQLGRNLNDEFAKGISEDLASSQNQNLKEDSALPPEVLSKLRKFEKYEDKYPKLLAAYKGERLKLEKVAEIEKVLTEYTPISSFEDAESLGAFFKDMKERQNLLNDEIRRLLTEGSTKNEVQEDMQNIQRPSSREKDNKNVETSQSDLEESRSNKEKELNKLREELETTNEAFENLKNEKVTLISSHEEHISRLQEELSELKAKDDEQEKSNNEIIERLRTENESLMKNVEESKEKLGEKESAIEGLRCQIGHYTEEIENMKKKLELYENETTKPSIASSKTTSKKKKKNNKKKTSANAEERPTTGVDEDISLDSKYKDACTKLESIENTLHASWEKKFDALETELKKSVDSESALREKLEKLEGDYKQLEEELSNSRGVIKEKESEVEETKDMMKTIGNELVDAKDKLKELSGLDKEDLIHLENELRDTRIELSCATKKSADIEEELTSSLYKMNRELETLKTSISSGEKEREHLTECNTRLTERYQRLQGENSTFAEQIKELENLKKTHFSLKSSMVQKEKTIMYLEQQVKAYSENIEANKKTADNIRLENKRSLALLENLKRDYEILQVEAKGKNESFEKYVKENGQLSERVSVLQNKYELLQNLKTNSSERTDSIKRQCEELTVKLREANKKILSLEDEVAEYSNMIHEKTRDITNMRRQISENSDIETTKEKELKEKLTCEADEKIKLQEELTLQATRKLRDVQYLKQVNTELKAELRRFQLKEQEFQADIVALESLNASLRSRTGGSKEDSDELERLAANLKQSLAGDDQKIHELQKTNENLMHTNEDVNEKLRRLSKNYKTVSKQLSELRETTRNGIKSSRSSSLTSNGEGILSNNTSGQSLLSSSRNILPPETASEMNEKVAYIKNVLLGFLEHKDQRTQLLPVVSMLLRFDSNDERRLMMSLK